MSHTNRCCVLALAGLFAGCVSYQPKPISAERTAKEFESRTLENTALRAFIEASVGKPLPEWPLKSWDLDTLTLAAFFYHPSLDLARAQWTEVNAALATAGGRPNPTVSATPGYNLSPASGVTPWIPGLNVDLPVETAGKRGHRVARARQLAEAARLNLATTGWQVRSNVRAALLSFSDAGQRERLLAEQLKLQEQLLARLEQRVDAGAMGRFEILPSRLALGNLRLEAGELERQVAEASVKLADAVGLPVAALNRAPAISSDWRPSAAVELTTEQVRHQALTSRADILAALAGYEAAQAALQLEVAKQFPDIHLGTGYQWDQGESKFNLGLSAEIPLLNRNQGPIAEAKARREIAAAHFIALQAKAISEIDAALNAHRGAQMRLTNLQTLAAQQKQQAAAVEAQAKAGALDGVDLLAAQIELAAAQLAQWDGTVRAAQASGQLEDALQMPLDRPASASAPLPADFIESNPRAAKEKP
jgi:outer membrane protein TolC